MIKKLQDMTNKEFLNLTDDEFDQLDESELMESLFELSMREKEEKMSKTFKVIVTHTEPDLISNDGTMIKNHYIIESGLTWQAAKDCRKQNKNSEIVPEVIK